MILFSRGPSLLLQQARSNRQELDLADAHLLPVIPANPGLAHLLYTISLAESGNLRQKFLSH